VKGAKTQEEAKIASKALSNSLLVKTASLWRRPKLGEEICQFLTNLEALSWGLEVVNGKKKP